LDNHQRPDQAKLTHLDYLQQTLHDPRDFHNWLVLGWSASDPKIALEFFQEALVLKPDDPVVLDSIRRAKQQISNLQPESQSGTARESLRQLQSLRPAPQATGAQASVPLRKPTYYWRVLVSRRMLITWVIVYLCAITLAELLTTILPVLEIGLTFHGLILIALVVHSALVVSRREQRLLLTLAFAPLIRMVSLSIPLSRLPQIYWYMIIGVPLFLAAFLVMKYAAFGYQEIGLTWRRWRLQLLIGVGGIGLGYLEYLILRPKPLASEISLTTTLLPALILLIFTGFLEEYIFRGLMQRAFVSIFGRAEGVLYVSFVFAVLHFGYKSILDVIFVFWVAIIFSVCVIYTGSIVGATMAHGLTNITLFLIFPIVLAGSPTGLTPRIVSPTPSPVIEQATLTVTPFQPPTIEPTLQLTPSAPIIEVVPLTPTPGPTSSPSVPAIEVIPLTPTSSPEATSTP
jgi:membrane protease YdiL (CAAX protease family)